MGASSMSRRRQGDRTQFAAVLPKRAVQSIKNRCIVGGDADDAGERELPTIVLEKNEEGNIAKITVRCPCGQFAELVCGYE